MRKFVVAANWKMHKTPSETAQFFASFLGSMPEMDSSSGVAAAAAGTAEREIIFFVPALLASETESCLRASRIRWGIQNCHFEVKGAFTGENSAAVAKAMGASHVLVGHSERRALFAESDEDTAKKVAAAASAGLSPMLCVGETLAEREAGRTSEVIVRQVRAGLSLYKPSNFVNGAGRVANRSEGAAADTESYSVAFRLAYEPVWAIGTGKVASPEMANEAHLTLRNALREIGGAAFADSVSILYGGSVKADNVAALSKQKEIDGFLVGGASLEVSSFMPICRV